MAAVLDHNKFHFVVLFYGDMIPFIPSWIDIFCKKSELSLFYQIIDIGLGSVYSDITLSLLSKIVNIFPSKIRYKIKSKKNNKSIQFIQLRQQIHSLSKSQFIQFLCELCTLLNQNHNLFAKILQFGFEQYKNKNESTSHLLTQIINDLCNKFNICSTVISETRNNEQITIIGYCRNHKVPIDIINLCFYYLYGKLRMHNEESNICDKWDKLITNKQIKIYSNLNRIKRSDPISHGVYLRNCYCAFGTEIISFGQKKIWKLEITPSIDAIIIGIVKCKKKNKYNLYNKNNEDFDFADNGYGYMIGSGMGYFGFEEKKITNKIIPNYNAYLVNVILDMSELQCSLKYIICGEDIGVAFDVEIDVTQKYKLAIGMYQPQKIQFLQ